jgi:hypothetical protein
MIGSGDSITGFLRKGNQQKSGQFFFGIIHTFAELSPENSTVTLW